MSREGDDLANTPTPEGHVWVVGQILKDGEAHEDRAWCLEGLWEGFVDAYNHAFEGGEDFWVSLMPLNRREDPESRDFSPVWWPLIEAEDPEVRQMMENQRKENG